MTFGFGGDGAFIGGTDVQRIDVGDTTGAESCGCGINGNGDGGQWSDGNLRTAGPAFDAGIYFMVGGGGNVGDAGVGQNRTVLDFTGRGVHRDVQSNRCADTDGSRSITTGVLDGWRSLCGRLGVIS